MLNKPHKPALERDGYCILESVLDPATITHLISFTESTVAKEDGRGGVRNLLNFSQMRELAASSQISQLVEPILGPAAKPVRGILFDKTDDANWKVPWHQDVTIAVAARIEVDGYGPWSVKSGVLHVQPPASVLENMLTVRIHLDDCPEKNGALRVINGSHRIGKIPERDAVNIVNKGVCSICAVPSGGALLMRPLLLHSSSAASTPSHRRVLHFDFAAGQLDGGLCWAVDVP